MSILAHAWSDNQGTTAHIEPMVWAGQQVFYEPGYTQRDFGLGDPFENGQQAASEIAAKPAGRRCLFLFNLGHAQAGLPDLASPAIEDYLLTGCDIAAWTARTNDFWDGFVDGGNPLIDFLYTDLEITGGHNFFEYVNSTAWADDVVTIQGGPAKGAITPALQVASHATLAAIDHSSSPKAFLVRDWNTSVRRILATGLRRVMLDTARLKLGYVPHSCNDQDMRGRWVAYDRQGWPEPIIPVLMGNSSSPELYNYTSNGSQERWMAWQGGQWPALIDNINFSKSAVGRFFPTLSAYNFQSGLPGPFQELVRHLGAMGTTGSIFFNVDETTSDQRAIHEAAFASAPTGQRYARTQTALGASAIRTGSVVTAYSAARFGPGGI